MEQSTYVPAGQWGAVTCGEVAGEGGVRWAALTPRAGF